MFSLGYFLLVRKDAQDKVARGRISDSQGKERALVSQRPRSVARMDRRAADTYLGFRTLSTPGCTVFLSIKPPFAELTDMVFGGPSMMDIIWTRLASLSHAVGEGT